MLIVRVDTARGRDLDEEERAALETAAGEIIADFPEATWLRVDYRTDDDFGGGCVVFLRYLR